MKFTLYAAALTLLLGQTAQAQSACSSDGQPAPTALLERFISADCETCWSDTQAALPGPQTVALDWIIPGALGDDAPLSAAARRDGLERLAVLGAAVDGPVPPGTYRLRVAHGLAVGGYIGTSIALLDAHPEPLTAWLLLIETIPAGSDGTAVERNVVRNSLVLDWNATTEAQREIRPMAIPDGAQAARLRVIGWAEDAHAHVLAAAQSRCAPTDE